jgi:hypothetical protein
MYCYSLQIKMGFKTKQKRKTREVCACNISAGLKATVSRQQATFTTI